jgi:hypothetical protein
MTQPEDTLHHRDPVGEGVASVSRAFFVDALGFTLESG